MIKTFAVFALLACVSAQATTIDFNEFASEPNLTQLGSGFDTQGFNFSYDATTTSQGKQFVLLQDFNGSTGPSLSVYPGGTTILSKADNGLFDISSVDLSFTEAQAVFTGYYSGGGSIQVTFSKSQSSWQTFNFDYSWVNLERVEITSPYAVFGNQFDNFVMTSSTTVPVPAALWLFASGLGLLGWIKRKGIA